MSKKLNFIKLSYNIDTSTDLGKAMASMFSIFAEFESNVIKRRTQTGLEAVKKRGIMLDAPLLKKILENK